MKKSNKGIEPIIGTVLLLLITVAAAAIIFGVIVPLIQDKLVQGGVSSCMNVRVVVDTKQGYTCFDVANDKVNVMVSRGADDTELSGIQIVVALQGGSTQAFEINQSLPSKNEQRTYSVDINTGSTATEVGIAPIVKMGNIKQLCGITSTAKLEMCN